MALLTSSRHGTLACCAAIVSSLLAGLHPSSRADAASPSALAEPVADEYDVKAAFVFNLARFVEWPTEAFAAPGTPLRVCVAGDSPFGGTLAEVLKGQVVGGRPITVVAGLNPEARDRCHIVYVPRSEEPRETETLMRLAGEPVLTIGEGRHFPDGGGVVGVGIDNRRVRFVVNLAAARRARLKMSARLLTLATAVQGLEGR